MSINVLNVDVKNNPALFSDPFQFEITFECTEPGINDELEWRLTYVPSAQNQSLDQELDSVLVGPISVGRSKFVLEADAPDISKIPINDLLDVTAVVLSGHYHEKEFIRVGFFVSVKTQNPLPLDAEGKPMLPADIKPSDLTRVIATDKPRVTRFQIAWTDETDELLAIVNTTKPEELRGFDMNDDNDEDALAKIEDMEDEDEEEDEDDDGDMDDVEVEEETFIQ